MKKNKNNTKTFLKAFFLTVLFSVWNIYLYQDLSRGFHQLDLSTFLNMLGYGWLFVVFIYGMWAALDDNGG